MSLESVEITQGAAPLTPPAFAMSDRACPEPATAAGPSEASEPVRGRKVPSLKVVLLSSPPEQVDTAARAVADEALAVEVVEPLGVVPEVEEQAASAMAAVAPIATTARARRVRRYPGMRILTSVV